MKYNQNRFHFIVPLVLCLISISNAQSIKLLGNVTVISQGFIRFNQPSDFVPRKGMKCIVYHESNAIALIEVVKVELAGIVAKIVDKNEEITIGNDIYLFDNVEKFWKKAKLVSNARKLELRKRYTEALRIYKEVLKIDHNDRKIKQKIMELKFKDGQQPSLIIHTDPKECSVFLDNSYIGKGSSVQKYNLLAGNYSLKIVPTNKEKYLEGHYDLVIKKYKTTELEVHLLLKKTNISSREVMKRQKKRLLTLDDLGSLKPEYKNKPQGLLPTIGGLVGIAIFVAAFEKKGTGKIDPDTGEEKKETKFNSGIGLLGIAVTWWGVEAMGKEPEKIWLSSNISYNNKLEEKLKKENVKIREYNMKIDKDYNNKLNYNQGVDKLNELRGIKINTY